MISFMRLYVIIVLIFEEDSEIHKDNKGYSYCVKFFEKYSGFV